MIKNIRIENYQSHKNTFLEFSEGINVISCNSNSGKTALLRALNWVINNRPQGIAFKSSFSDKKDLCEVSIDINNNIITRKKNNSVNSYEIGSSLIFDTLGNNIPIEVSNIINMSDINIQNQFEKHFLLTDSAGEVGRTINKVVNLDIIDELISNLNSKVLSINKEMDIKKQDLDKIYLNLDKFKDLDIIEKLINEITEADTKLNNYKNIVLTLNHIISELNKADRTIKETEDNFINLELQVNELQELWVNYNTKTHVQQELTLLCSATIVADNIINKSEQYLTYEIELQEFEELNIKYKSKNEDLTELKNLMDKWNSVSIKDSEEIIKNVEEEFNKFIEENNCPLCGRRGKNE